MKSPFGPIRRKLCLWGPGSAHNGRPAAADHRGGLFFRHRIAVPPGLRPHFRAAVLHGRAARAAIGDISVKKPRHRPHLHLRQRRRHRLWAKVVKATTDIVNGRLRTPTRIPEKVQGRIKESEPPPIATIGGVIGGVPVEFREASQEASSVALLMHNHQCRSCAERVEACANCPTHRASQGVTKGTVVYRIRTDLATPHGAGAHSRCGSTESDDRSGREH